MASTASASALAISIFAAQDLYYNVRPSAAVGVFTCATPFDLSPAVFLWWYKFSLIGSQLIGYGFAGGCSSLMFSWYLIYLPGVMRSFLVYPTFAVYPQLMPQVQLFDVLHRSKSASLQKIRLKFFWIVFIGIFVWEWFPVCFIVFNFKDNLADSPRRNILPRRFPKFSLHRD
jgi:uncharacterized protein with PQ loop repeat